MKNRIGNESGNTVGEGMEWSCVSSHFPVFSPLTHTQVEKRRWCWKKKSQRVRSSFRKMCVYVCVSLVTVFSQSSPLPAREHSTHIWRQKSRMKPIRTTSTKWEPTRNVQTNSKVRTELRETKERRGKRIEITRPHSPISILSLT